MSAVLIGIGQFVGRTDSLEEAARGFVVRHGVDVAVLSAVEYRVWDALSKRPQARAEIGESVTAFRSVISEEPIDEVVLDATVEVLRDRGLVALIEPETYAATRLAFSLRVVPLARATSLFVADKDRYPAVTVDNKVLWMSSEVHRVWRRLDWFRNVADMAVVDAREAGVALDDADIEAAWRQCLAVVAAGAGYFDISVEYAPPS